MKLTKKGPFQAQIDLTQIPSFRSRFGSVMPQGEKVSFEAEKVSIIDVDACKDLRAKFNTMQDIRALPSVILRRKGRVA